MAVWPDDGEKETKFHTHGTFRQEAFEIREVVSGEIIHLCDDKDDDEKLRNLEREYISEHNAVHPNGFNMTIGGEPGSGGWKKKRYLLREIYICYLFISDYIALMLGS